MNLADSKSKQPSKHPFWKRISYSFFHLLNRQTILLLAILFIAGLAAALYNMSRLSSDLIESQASQSSALYAQAIKEARTLYSNNAVSRIKDVHGINVTADYGTKPGAIPLPATYLIELSKSISEQNPGMAVRLYSDLPFPGRREEGGPKDDFEWAALNHLRQNPNQPYIRIEPFQGRPAFRYAEADVMKASCVACHNSHPDSPKRDWKEGDVRGILEITRPLDSFIAQTQAGLRGTFFMLAGLLLLALLGIAIVITRLKQTSKDLERRVIERTSQLRHANQQLTVEQDKSNQLLLNILPGPIAEQLKEGQSSIAEGFSEATVLFADLVNFTTLSEHVSPSQLIALLNEIFSRFDRLTEKHGLEKIKTIGDAYMVVGGLPMPRRDHAEAIAEMALDMLGEITMFSLERGYNCDIRIGINSGPVIAGVIGTKKFIYDLWGDTVNVASRMESHGIPGEIQVTAETYERLKHRFTFQSRGTINIKGKGQMTVYLLTGHKTSQSQRRSPAMV